jgi:4-hydroxybenzoyl-CoA reductase subunit beta
MMRAPPFRYVAARSIAEAARALADGGPQAMLLAGGTDLVPNMKRRQQRPEVLVSLRRVADLRRVAAAGAGLAIGCGATLAELTDMSVIRERHRALHRAAAQVATPQIRHMGTIGGNLCLDTRCNYYDQNYEWRQAIDFCKKAPGPAAVAIPRVVAPDDGVCWVAPGSERCWAVSSSDTAPALVALGARATLFSAGAGEREIALEDLYADDGMAYLNKRPDEILTSVRIASPREGLRSTYWKLRRRGSFDFPVLSVAAAVRFAAGRVVEEARVVLGAVASRPVIVPDAASLLGRELTDDAIEAFAEAAARLAKPLDNTDFALSWRKRVARSYVAGALRELRGDDPATFTLLQRHAGRELPVVL